ncbi:MAG TPA: sigma-70 family RNA polymerase sigma factor [Thermomicrobiales bacterium]|jgi:RNA polymerase sigma-70 factor (ECF subfamily)
MPRWPRRSHGAPGNPPTAGDAGVAVLAVAEPADAAIDPALYDAIFRRTVNTIYRICLTVLHDPAAADDATGAVLEKLARRLPTGDVQNVDAWLRRVAKTTAIDHLRAMRHHAPLDEAFEVEDPAPTPEDLVLDADLRRVLRAHVSLLPPAQRQVIELRLDGLTAEEIAHLLGKQRGAIDITTFRAIRRLREQLRPGVAAEGGTR